MYLNPQMLYSKDSVKKFNFNYKSSRNNTKLQELFSQDHSS